MAKGVEIPFFFSQNKAGVLITAKKTDIKNGTIISTAAFIPATTITNAAAMIKNLAGPGILKDGGVEFCCFFVVKRFSLF